MGFEPHQLRRIEDVAIPKAVEGRCRNEVLTLRLVSEEPGIGLKLFQCFT
jgi:hypothetical protein